MQAITLVIHAPLLLKSALIVGLILAWNTAQAEPSESEMRAAVEAQLNNVNAGTNETAERCNNRDFNRGQGDPVLAMQCLMFGMGAGVANEGRDVRAPQFSVTRFEKIACEKAQGKAGYVCDYVFGYGSNMPNNPTEQITRSGSAAQGRFVKRDGRWLRLESP